MCQDWCRIVSESYPVAYICTSVL